MLAIAYIREALKKKVSYAAGYLGIARILGLHYPKMSKSSARRELSKWAERQYPNGVYDETVKPKPIAIRNKRPNVSFYETREWRELRYQALTLHGGKCQCCGRSASDGVVLHVDHVKPKSKFPELALSLNNLQVLCADCNLGKSNKDSTDWRLMREYSDFAIQQKLRLVA